MPIQITLITNELKNAVSKYDLTDADSEEIKSVVIELEFLRHELIIKYLRPGRIKMMEVNKS